MRGTGELSLTQKKRNIQGRRNAARDAHALVGRSAGEGRGPVGRKEGLGGELCEIGREVRKHLPVS